MISLLKFTLTEENFEFIAADLVTQRCNIILKFTNIKWSVNAWTMCWNKEQFLIIGTYEQTVCFVQAELYVKNKQIGNFMIYEGENKIYLKFCLRCWMK